MNSQRAELQLWSNHGGPATNLSAHCLTATGAYTTQRSSRLLDHHTSSLKNHILDLEEGRSVPCIVHLSYGTLVAL